MVKTIETELANEDVYSDAIKLKEVNVRYATFKETLGALQLHWEQVANEVDSLSKSITK